MWLPILQTLVLFYKQLLTLSQRLFPASGQLSQKENDMSDPITPLSPAQTATQEVQASKEGYVLRLLIAADMFANVMLGGHEDETISTDTGLMATKHQFVGVVVSRALDLFQSDHGAKAGAGDLERAQQEVIRLETSGVVGP
jgi:hypothetical protein